MIGLADDLLLVLDDDDGVLLGAQLLEDLHQPLAVARVQADRRLVENVERVHQRGADGAGQVDARQLAAGQRARLAVERQVVEADGEQVAQPVADLAEDEAARSLPRVRRELQAGEERRRVGDAHAVDVGDAAAVDACTASASGFRRPPSQAGQMR